MRADLSSAPMLLRPTEAAKALGVHPQSLANWRAAGRGPKWCKLGVAVRYSVTALEEFIAENTKTPAAGR